MFQLGDVIGGKYCLEKQIGVGGMATIWRAVHMDLDRPVAVKFLSVIGVDPEKVRDKFIREARLAASVRHRNVVDIIDFGTTESGAPYMVMELLEGKLLADRLVDGPPLHVAEYIRIVAAALTGLQAVHDAGIIHRDLKPENVFLVRDSDSTAYPKLLDFGISRADRTMPTTLRSSVPTMDGLIVGTPHYMSPEQARGLRDVDYLTDIYSMGVILYEGLAGQLPFDSENPGDLLMMVTTQVATPLSALRPELGQALSDVVERAMARDRHARFQTALEMRDALLEAAEKTAVLAPGWGTATARFRVQTASSTETQDADVPLEPASRGRGGTALWITAAAAAVGAAVGIGILTQAGGASDASEVSRDPIPAAAPAPMVTEAPAAEESEEPDDVFVDLEGVPIEADVFVDGELVAGDRIVLARDGRSHLIEVEAEGYESWRVGHTATADGRYVVTLDPEARPARGRARQRRREAERGTKRAPEVPARPTREQGTPFTDPGF